MTKRLITEQQEVDFAGERVSHLFPNDCYYAHLSIYHFASQFSAGKVILDSGCGAGYGSNYFADHGAKSVNAVDISTEAVEFCNRHFSAPGLTYQVMDLQNITGFQPKTFDLVFSSNALEHVPNLRPFFYSAWQLLKPDGTVVIAVPPVVDEISLKNNLDNNYHLNIWSPRQWHSLLSQYFASVQPYRHGFDKPGIQLDFNNTVEQTRVTETDFLFEPVDLDDFYKSHTLTVIFVARQPRPARNIPGPEQPLRFVDESYTRLMDGSISASKKNNPAGAVIKGWQIFRQQGFGKAARAGLRHFKPYQSFRVRVSQGFQVLEQQGPLAFTQKTFSWVKRRFFPKAGLISTRSPTRTIHPGRTGSISGLDRPIRTFSSRIGCSGAIVSRTGLPTADQHHLASFQPSP